MASSHAKTLRLAQAAGDADAIGKLEKIGPPPWSNPRNFGVARRLRRKHDAQVQVVTNIRASALADDAH